MATSVKYPRNADVDEIRRIAIGAVLNSQIFIPIPNFKKMITINVDKNGEDVRIETANQTRKRTIAAGDTVALPITDLEDSEIVWGELDTGTDDFVGGDSAGITGIRITVLTAPGPTTSVIDISILGYDRV